MMENGAFVLKNRDSKKIVLEKNKNYWDAKRVNLPQIKVEMSRKSINLNPFSDFLNLSEFTYRLVYVRVLKKLKVLPDFFIDSDFTGTVATENL